MSIMINPVPILSTSLLTEFDQHTLTPTLYSLQEYVIPASTFVYLQEQPVQSSLSIPTGVTVATYTETLGVPGALQFSVNYLNGSIQFNAANVGATVQISYSGVGSVVLAETINNMNSYIVAAYNVVAAINPSLDATTFVSVNVASDPVSPVLGQTWFNTTDSQFKGFNGTSVVILG